MMARCRSLVVLASVCILIVPCQAVENGRMPAADGGKRLDQSSAKEAALWSGGCFVVGYAFLLLVIVCTSFSRFRRYYGNSLFIALGPTYYSAPCLLFLGETVEGASPVCIPFAHFSQSAADSALAALCRTV